MRLTIRTKLVGGLGAVLVLMGLVACVAYTRLDAIARDADVMFWSGTLTIRP